MSKMDFATTQLLHCFTPFRIVDRGVNKRDAHRFFFRFTRVVMVSPVRSDAILTYLNLVKSTYFF